MKSCTKAGTGCGGCSNLLKAGGGSDLADLGVRGGQGVVRALRLRPSGALSPGQVGELKELRALPGQAWPGAGVRHLQADGGLYPGVPLERHVLEKPHRALQDTNDAFLANLQRTAPIRWCRFCIPGITRRLITIGEVARTASTPDHRRPAHRSLRRPGRPAACHLGRAGGGGLQTGQAYGKSVRTVKSCVGLHLVSLRGAGLHDPDPDPGAPLQRGCGRHTS